MNIKNKKRISTFVLKLTDENNIEYFFKEIPLCIIVKELLAQNIAKLVGVDNVKYLRFQLDGIDGVISESFIEAGYHYMTGTELLTNYIRDTRNKDIELLYNESEYNDKYSIKANQDLYIIWQAMEAKFKNYPDYENQILKFMNDVINMMLFDLLIANGDRGPYNWTIKYNDSTFGLSKVYDNEYSFSSSPYSSLNTTQDFPSASEALRMFLNESDDSMLERVWNFFNIVTPNNINSILETTIQNSGILLEESDKDFIINSFLDNYKNLEEVIRNRMKTR